MILRSVRQKKITIYSLFGSPCSLTLSSEQCNFLLTFKNPPLSNHVLLFTMRHFLIKRLFSISIFDESTRWMNSKLAKLKSSHYLSGDVFSFLGMSSVTNLGKDRDHICQKIYATTILSPKKLRKKGVNRDKSEFATK